MTGNLRERILKHRVGNAAPFMTQYNYKKLVYFCRCLDKVEALKKEKQIKNWRREWKITLIEKQNPLWEDFFDYLV